MRMRARISTNGLSLSSLHCWLRSEARCPGWLQSNGTVEGKSAGSNGASWNYAGECGREKTSPSHERGGNEVRTARGCVATCFHDLSTCKPPFPIAFRPRVRVITPKIAKIFD